MDGETSHQVSFPEQPEQQPGPEPVRTDEAPSGHAILKIAPTTVVPASQTHMLLMSATGIAGIM
jgi:hypothetical protein